MVKTCIKGLILRLIYDSFFLFLRTLIKYSKNEHLRLISNEITNKNKPLIKQLYRLLLPAL